MDMLAERGDQKVRFGMQSVRCALEIQVEMRGYNWTCESGIRRRGLGWRFKFGGHQFINDI